MRRMDIIRRHNNIIYPADGFDGERVQRVLGVNQRRVRNLTERGHSVRFGQLRHLVMPGLIVASALFQGLQRPLMQRDNKEADADKLVYVRKPSYDFEWDYADSFRPDRVRRLPAPEKAVFFVIATPNTVPKYRERYPEIFAWIERWGWTNEDPGEPGLPKDHDARYKTRLW